MLCVWWVESHSLFMIIELKQTFVKVLETVHTLVKRERDLINSDRLLKKYYAQLNRLCFLYTLVWLPRKNILYLTMINYIWLVWCKLNILSMYGTVWLQNRLGFEIHMRHNLILKWIQRHIKKMFLLLQVHNISRRKRKRTEENLWCLSQTSYIVLFINLLNLVDIFFSVSSQLFFFFIRNCFDKKYTFVTFVAQPEFWKCWDAF